MKKTYINPANKVYNVQTYTLIAESGGTQSLPSGGSNGSGGPTKAETREEASWSAGDAWNEEW